MSTPALIATILIAALVIALFVARKSVNEFITFKKMDAKEQAEAIAKAQRDNRYWSGRHSKISFELIFAGVFLSLACLCAWCGLYYTCGYTFFHGTIMLSEAIRNQVRLFIMNHEDPTVVESAQIFEFRTA
ncbi:hypothetical protein [Burkholderia phage FLC9]|nr:hypothetical protein [Burkholderia phage FLC9]